MNKDTHLFSAMYYAAIMILSAAMFFLFCGLGHTAATIFCGASIISAAAFAYMAQDTGAYPKRFLFVMLVATAIISPICAYVTRDFMFEAFGQTVTSVEAVNICAVGVVVMFAINALCQYAAGRVVKWGLGTTWDKRLPNRE